MSAYLCSVADPDGRVWGPFARWWCETWLTRHPAWTIIEGDA